MNKVVAGSMPRRKIEIVQVAEAARAMVARGTNAGTTLLFFHGAGLEPDTKLYFDLAQSLPTTIEIVLPYLSASHFVSFEAGFRAPKGWACHNPNAIANEVTAWIDRYANGQTRLIVGGHSWGAYVAASMAKDADLFLVSPITSLRSLVEANFESADGVPPGQEWVRCNAGAPLPFVMRDTAVALSEGTKHISEILAASQAKALIAYGTKEHALIRDWLDGPRGLSQRAVSISGAGHFYTSHAVALADAFVDWLASS